MAKQKKSEFIDVNAIVREYISKWYWFAISVFVCVALGWLAAKVMKPKYSINANVLISQDEKGGMASLGAIGDLFGSNASVDDEIFVISSHSLYRDVVKTLATNKVHKVRRGFLDNEFAYPHYPLDVYAAPGIIDTLRTAITFKVDVDEKGLASVKAKAKREVVAKVKDKPLPVTVQTIYGAFVIDTTSYYVPGEELSTSVSILGYDAAAELLGEDVDANIGSKRSNSIRLGMNTVNTDYGKDVLNEIITKYNERGIAEKNLQGEKTAKFIDERLAIISSDLSDAENVIQSYKETKGIIDVGSEAGYQTGIRAETERHLAAAETQAEIIRMTSEFLNNPENAHSLIPMTSDVAGLQEGIKDYNDLLILRMNLATNAKPNNKSLQLLDKKIDAIREVLIGSVAKAYENNEINIRELRSKMNSAMSRLSSVPSQEREFLNMKRQQEVKQQLYLFLLQRREETAMMLANATPKGLIVDEAYSLTEPVNMSKKMILFIAVMIGLCIPPALLYVRKLLRTKFDTKEEVEAAIDVPVLGEICNDKSGRTLVAVRGDHSSTTELFNLLRSRLPFVLGGDGEKVVLLTSTRSGEGKSFVSVNLSSDMALLDKKVLLIGMDVRKPRLTEYLNVAPRFGLTQYLASKDITIDSMIVRDEQAPQLDIITSGPVPPNPAELLNSKRLDELMAELRKRYDYIFIDSAPVGMVSDTFTLDRLSDATIYVVRADYTMRSDLRFIDEIYGQKRLKKLSVVVNGTTTKRGYGYGYGEKKA